MSKFQARTAFSNPNEKGYQLLPFKFISLDDSRYVLVNMAGDFLTVDEPDLRALVDHSLSSGEATYRELRARHFLTDTESSVAKELLAIKVRSRYRMLPEFTGLHMFVASLRCEHSCPYCQVSRQSTDKTRYDMSETTAEKALGLVFRSPSKTIKIEFQGGEPLLNFPIVEHVVRRAKAINHGFDKNLVFVIATNLALIDDRILDFCEEHDIQISTSLDGPKDLHNKNRPRPGGDSYERAIAGIQRARKSLGRDKVSALMTTTAASLGRINEIIDEYVEQGFAGIFLRPLSPFGFAVKTKSFSKYSVQEWLEFYKTGIRYIIDLNKKGLSFSEFYAQTILKKMLTCDSPGYVDLMSPAGIGIAGVVYNYDGDVYASDEGRMLAESGEKQFRLGNVMSDSYEDIFLSDALLDPIEQSFAKSVPMCSDCAFEEYCGSDPVYHWATQRDAVGKKPNSGFCARNMEIIRFLISTMEADPFAKQLFLKWAT